MENTWASGAIELLKHADSHIQLDTAFDSRIAFISIDNSVEISIRVFLSLPEKISGVHISKKELDEVGNSFPKMVDLLFSKRKLPGLVEADIEHYHRIRNKLYHEGTGLAVDRQYLGAYREIAVILLRDLFDVRHAHILLSPKDVTLGNLILLFNEIESIFIKKIHYDLGKFNDDFKWEMIIAEVGSDTEDAADLTRLREIRNEQVHSSEGGIDKSRIGLGIKIARNIINKFS